MREIWTEVTDRQGDSYILEYFFAICIYSLLYNLLYNTGVYLDKCSDYFKQNSLSTAELAQCRQMHVSCLQILRHCYVHVCSRHLVKDGFHSCESGIWIIDV